MGKRAARDTSEYAAQWEPEEVTLPTRRKVLLQQPDLYRMVREGLVPDQLLPIVERFTLGGETSETEKPSPGQLLRDYAARVEHYDILAVAACVEPRLVRGDAGPGELSVSRLFLAEKIHIWRWTEGLTAPLATFPDDADQAAGDLPPVAVGDGDGAAAEQPAGSDEAP